MDSSPSDLGGYKEIIFNVTGTDVFKRLKYESGVHRVQRVPATEAQGRIHTSTATVAVLPEAEEVDIEIKPEDLEITVCRASGPGGQGVNTTDSAVQIIHKPTGMIVRCADQRSQQKNKARAMTVLALAVAGSAKLPKKTPNTPPIAKHRSAPANATSAFALTISRRTASPIIASNLRLQPADFYRRRSRSHDRAADGQRT